MRTIRTKDGAALAEELAAVRTELRRLRKREEELKEYFRLLFSDDKVLRVGRWLLILNDCQRTDLDKAALTELLGEKIHKYEKKTAYQVLEIKAT